MRSIEFHIAFSREDPENEQKDCIFFSSADIKAREQ